MGTANVTMSDPPVNSQYSNAWVTVDGVEASVSTSDTGFVPLVSSLSSTPGAIKAVQIDLLNLPTNGTNSNCLLALLGSTTSLPAGNYQQIRLILVPNNAPSSSVTLMPYSGETPSTNIPNECASVNAWNCAMPTGGSLTALQLSSQAQTGLKIPPGQVMGGPIDVAQGSSVDINIDFNADRSIVQQGPGELRLDPVLVAYQTSPNLTGISGQVISGTVVAGANNLTVTAGSPLAGASIAVESNTGNPQYNNVPVDLIGNSITTTDTNGNFDICPLPTGPFDLVASAGPTGTTTVTTDGATIVTGVPNGVQVTIPVVQQPAPATIGGDVTATPATSGATSVSADLFALQPYQTSTEKTPSLYFSVPLLGGSNPTLAQITVTCTGGTCSTANNTTPDFSLVLPPATPLLGVYGTSGITWSLPAPSSTGTVSYNVEATCTTSSGTGSAFSSTQTVTSGNKTSLTSPLSLTGCE
jgi:hypothetical protein